MREYRGCMNVLLRKLKLMYPRSGAPRTLPSGRGGKQVERGPTFRF